MPPLPLNIVILALATLAVFTSAGVPLQRFDALIKQQSQDLGLYNHTDKVHVLTDVNFKETVVNQTHSSLVEFYNSYCGHCKRFAPIYKQLAEQLYPWRSVLIVGAIDCAAEENNGICREYEIMAYPTMRYFGPGYAPSANSYGLPIQTQNLTVIRYTLAQSLLAENRTAKIDAWPNLQPVSEVDVDSLFEGNSQSQYAVLIFEPENTTLGVETALHFVRWPDVQVRRIVDSEIAAKFQIDTVKYKIAIVDRQKRIVPYSSLEDTAPAYAQTIESFLRTRHLTERPSVEAVAPNTTPYVISESEVEDNANRLNEVLRNKHFVYQADLEMAMRGALFNEIPKKPVISGESLLALQNFLAVLKRYNTLGENGRKFIAQVSEYVMKSNQQISGNEFEAEVRRLESQLKPVFSTNHYVGCNPSRPGLRGFTCSMWVLFHSMTVQASNSNLSQDPLEVLQAIHGYVKNFFGCTDCAEHFQVMAKRRKIWSTPTKDEAVLWLWSAHNEVNKRLAGDDTEDPKFPKIQFPSQWSCSSCYREPVTSPSTLELNWNKDAVLSFLKNIHNPGYVSRFGVEHEEVLQPSLEKLRQKRMVSSVFSDMDMRMGMLLYGFCIVMMVVAFKLFAFKGYRKKPYSHDLLGKV